MNCVINETRLPVHHNKTLRTASQEARCEEVRTHERTKGEIEEA